MKTRVNQDEPDEPAIEASTARPASRSRRLSEGDPDE